MSTRSHAESVRTAPADGAAAPLAFDPSTLDREALLQLNDALFRWVLKHTGLTRHQVLAQIEREGGWRR